MLARTKSPSAPVADGITDLPPGKIAAVATYLDMKAVPDWVGRMPREPERFEPLAGDLPRYRALYARIGEPWLWFSRAVLSDEQLRAVIDDPAVEALSFVLDGRDVGMIELNFRKPGHCELAFLGLAPDAVGRALGRRLIAEAIRRAFARPIDVLWLHTCTLDHPAAVPFYLKVGFRPFRRAIEIADDPRLTGHMSAGAGPLFPTV